MSESLSKAFGEQERVSEELDAILTLRDRLLDELGEAKGERDRLSAEAAQSSQQLEANAERLRASAAQIAAINARLADADRSVADKSAELERSQGRMRELDTRLTAANTRVTALEGDVERLEREKGDAVSRLAEMERRLGEQLRSRDVQIERLENDLTLIRLGGDILFASGSVELRREGREALRAIAAELKKFPEHTISLEGHTDAVPLGEALRERFGSNWELSVARASEALRYLVSQGIDPRRLRAVGYGSQRPVGEDDARNRRIEILLLPPSERRVVTGALSATP